MRMHRTHFFGGAVALLVVIAAGLTGVVVPATMDGIGIAQPANVTQSGSCDYNELYNQTIDSVVSVRTNTGLGSGFVYRLAAENATSYIITNAHVVGPSATVLVQFSQEETKRGTVVGRDRLTDLAVIRVNDTPEYVESLPVADSAPEQGRKVAALGNPFGLDETITHGIISGRNRSLPTRFGYSLPNIIQTDAPINPGNSGGPLIACNGTVVGVNTAEIAAVSAENIGFAISPNLVRKVVPTLIRTGDYDHAYLGVRTFPLTPRLLAANNLDVTTGIYVHEVVAGGPASGVLQETSNYTTVGGARVPVGGDVIVSIEGQPIASAEDLSSYLITETHPGETVTLTVIRNGEQQRVTVTLGKRPDITT